MLTVIGDAMHTIDARKGPVFTQDFCRRSSHRLSLIAWQETREQQTCRELRSW